MYCKYLFLLIKHDSILLVLTRLYLIFPAFPASDLFICLFVLWHTSLYIFRDSTLYLNQPFSSTQLLCVKRLYVPNITTCLFTFLFSTCRQIFKFIHRMNSNCSSSCHIRAVWNVFKHLCIRGGSNIKQAITEQVSNCCFSAGVVVLKRWKVTLGNQQRRCFFVVVFFALINSVHHYMSSSCVKEHDCTTFCTAMEYHPFRKVKRWICVHYIFADVYAWMGHSQMQWLNFLRMLDLACTADIAETSVVHVGLGRPSLWKHAQSLYCTDMCANNKNKTEYKPVWVGASYSWKDLLLVNVHKVYKCTFSIFKMLLIFLFFCELICDLLINIFI